MLVIIDPSTRHPEAEVCAHIVNSFQGPSCIARFALPSELCIDERKGAPSSESLVISSLNDVPLSTITGVMILGGGASPADELIWQTELIRWLTQPLGPISRRAPILGVCYGHQLLGAIFGSKVELLWEGECANGLRAVSLSEPTLGLKAHQPYPLVISHREGLRSTPQEWRSICSTTSLLGPENTQPAHAVEAMCHKDAPWWGFQAHIDATPAFLTNNNIVDELPQPYAGAHVIGSFLRQL
jgi:GMP synthase-like glutamine amidotransferase